MVKIALAVVAAVLLNIVASEPLGLEVEIKPKFSNEEQPDLGSSLTGQEKSALSSSLDSQWEAFKMKFSRNYSSIEQDNLRKSLFAANLKLIQSNNFKRSRSFTMGVNKFADYTEEEYRRLLGGRTPAPVGRTMKSKAAMLHQTVGRAPDWRDWRHHGYVTPVKDQGKWCRSCWAFAAVATMEGAWMKKHKSLVSLSEQQLVDCMPPWTEGAGRCDGNWPGEAIQWAQHNQYYSMASEAAYSYRGWAGDGSSCRSDSDPPVATITGMKIIERNSEYALKDAVGNVGPVAVVIDASHPSFKDYDSGVYVEDQCSTSYPDHAVTVVGYGHEDGRAYWLVKNSWGDDWGEGGYIKMLRNHNNMCGIATWAVYAVA